LKSKYVYVNGMLVGKIDANDELFQYFHDGLGSITMITDTTGSYENLYVYDDFGNFRMIEESGSAPNHYYYTGQERDPAPSGLYNLRARYYAAGIGRFTQEDPYYSFSGMANPGGCSSFSGVTRILVADPKYINFYVYGLNNPINYKDITGLDPWSDPCGKWKSCLEGVWSKHKERSDKTYVLFSDCLAEANKCDDSDFKQKIDECMADIDRRHDANWKHAMSGDQECNRIYGSRCFATPAINIIIEIITFKLGLPRMDVISLYNPYNDGT